MVWSPWDFLRWPAQCHSSPGAHRGDRMTTQGIPTSLAFWAWVPPQARTAGPCVCHQTECKQAGISRGWIWNIAFQTARRSPSQTWVSQEVSRNQGQVSPWLVLCPLQWEWWFLPCELAESYLQELSTALDLQLTGACEPWISPELPQHLQGLNLGPWSPGSNLLKCAVTNATAQILLLTQNEQLLRDFERVMG